MGFKVVVTGKVVGRGGCLKVMGRGGGNVLGGGYVIVESVVIALFTTEGS